MHILVEHARLRGVENVLDHLVAQWAVRHADWIQNFLVKRDVDLQDEGTVRNTPHVAHTGDKAPNNVGFLERVLVRCKINDDKQPRFLICWALGYKDADIITLMGDGSVGYNGSWQCSPEGRSETSELESQDALMLRKNTKPRVQGLACEHGINDNLRRRHIVE